MTLSGKIKQASVDALIYWGLVFASVLLICSLGTIVIAVVHPI